MPESGMKEKVCRIIELLTNERVRVFQPHPQDSTEEIHLCLQKTYCTAFIGYDEDPNEMLIVRQKMLFLDEEEVNCLEPSPEETVKEELLRCNLARFKGEEEDDDDDDGEEKEELILLVSFIQRSLWGQ